MRAKRIALNSAVYTELSSGSRHVKGFLIRLVDTAAAATPSSVLEPSVKKNSDNGYSEINGAVYIFLGLLYLFCNWLGQNGLQELKVSKGQCPTREHRLPNLG